jgi:hypothetical protein
MPSTRKKSYAEEESADRKRSVEQAAADEVVTEEPVAKKAAVEKAPEPVAADVPAADAEPVADHATAPVVEAAAALATDPAHVSLDTTTVAVAAAAAVAAAVAAAAATPVPAAVPAPVAVPVAAPTPQKPPANTTKSPAEGSTTSSSKPYKGLRHFSMMVCKKVEEKGTTSYNEVADELVNHVVEERRKEDPSSKFDEKNIRRRVYDALNVLMAMDIITKDKKAITWKGLPTTAHQDLDMLEREREFRRSEVERKREALRELLVQQVCFRNLVEHNQERETEAGKEPEHKIPLPFIVVNTHSSAVIQCNMSRDLTDVMFDFSMPFEINDDNTILKRLGM